MKEESQDKQWKVSALKPEQWGDEQLAYKSEQWAEIERLEHDERYAESYPFGLDTYQFTPERALWFEDYAYKKGRRRDRGHRTRKVFEIINLDSLDGKRVLDIGCGIGQYSVLFAMKGAEVTGVELSPVAIEIAKKMAEENGVADRCTFVAGEFTKLDLGEGSFDVVMMHEVYHHLIKYDGAKEKVLRYPKPGGMIVSAEGMRGGGLVHAGRRLVKYVRHKVDPKTREEEVQAGDVLLSIDDLHALGRQGRSYEIFTMSFLYMIKATFLKHHTDKFVVRVFLRSMKLADDVLLALFPPLRKHCGEAVLYIVTK